MEGHRTPSKKTTLYLQTAFFMDGRKAHYIEL